MTPEPIRVGRSSFRNQMDQSEPLGSGAGLTIGAISRETGLSRDTLRVWQRRYGFPVPVRKPSGHRLYSPADLCRLKQVSEALSRGYRPSEVISLQASDLQALLAEERSWDSAHTTPAAALLEHVRRHRLTELTAGLMAEAAALGPLDFLRHLLIPLTERVGEAWARGEISIRHEHAFFDRAGDVLRALRLTYERTATGPGVLLATLSGELHRLGLQMAALVTGIARLRPHVLGSSTSVSEIAFAWDECRASAIALSVSAYTGGPAVHRHLVELRRLVPQHVPIVVGGCGAVRSRPPTGVWLIEGLEDYHGWLRRLGSRQSSSATPFYAEWPDSA
jgi:DNA-binding transcriptional MerR regulator